VHYPALMDDEAAALAHAVGERVRNERRARDWTLDRLAEAAGVSRRMVVNVEQGTVNPSIGTLLRLAGALGSSLPTLVEPPRSAPLTVTRRGEGALLWTGDAGGQGRLLTSAGHPDAFELWDWTLLPGDVRTSDAHAPGTTELLHVLEGGMTVEAAEHRVVLETGDAVSFAADVPHSYANPGPHPARFSLAVLEPGAAPRPIGDRP
jgi:transcriptional regulator with XRE-family HTH domain